MKNRILHNFKKLFTLRAIIIAVLFGVLSMMTIYWKISFYLTGTSASSDPREVFNSLGAAITGPVGAIIIGFLSTSLGGSSSLYYYVLIQHCISALWIGIAYKKLVYDKYDMPDQIIGWLILQFVYSFIIYIPGFYFLFLCYHSKYVFFVGNDLPIWQGLIKLYSGWLPEIIFTAIMTTLIIIAIPEKYRKPIWGKSFDRTNNREKLNRLKKIYLQILNKKFIAIRLSLWFIILFSIPILYLSVLFRNYFTDFILTGEGKQQYEIVKNIADVITNTPQQQFFSVLDNIKSKNNNTLVVLDKNVEFVKSLNPHENSAIQKLYLEKIDKAKLGNKVSGFYTDNKLLLAVGYIHLKNGFYLLSLSSSKYSASEISQLIFFLIRYIGYSLLITAFIAGIIIWLIVGMPLRKITAVANEIGNHNYDIKIDTSDMSDEVGALAKSINIMKNNIKYAEESLSESEIRFRNLFENAPIGIYRTTPDGQITASNPYLIRMLGYSSFDDLSVRNMEQKSEFSYSRADFKKRIERDGYISGFEEIWYKKDGTQIFVRENSQIVRDNLGNVLYYDGTVEDITERKIVEERLRKLSLAVEQSSVSIIITNLKAEIEYINPYFTKVTGYTLEEVRGKNPRILQSSEKQNEKYSEMWKNLIAGNQWSGIFHNKKKNGELFWESANISPIKNEIGEFTHYVAVKEDITEKKRTLEELIVAKEKAEEMSKLKSNFLSNMSHELRTPLIGILGISELLKERMTDKEVQNMADIIERSGHRLLQTLNLILNLSKIESEDFKLDYETFDTINSIKTIINLFKAVAEKKGLNLQLNCDYEKIEVHLDKSRFNEIIENLVNNAIKYTDKGSIKVKVSIETTVENIWLIIIITDTGIGISKEDQKIIFQEFRQASEGFARSFDGTGLGLTISKRLVEKMGGSILLESNIGIGSSFIVKLPLKKNALDYVENAKYKNEEEDNLDVINLEVEDFPLSQLNPILLVEDDYVSMAATKAFLKNVYVVESSTNAENAIKMAQSKIYSAILMDINLGRGMSGAEAAKEIKLLPGYKNIPIIAMTAFAMRGDKEEFLSSGCTHYITKPFAKRELLDLLKGVIGSIN